MAGTAIAFDLENVQLTTLPVELIHEAAVLAASVFANTVGYTFIYGGTEDMRRSELEWLFKRNISMIYERSPEACYCGMDTSAVPARLCCFFMLADEETSSISFCQKVMSGILWLPFRVNFATLQRLLEVAAYADKTEAEIAPVGSPLLRLARMAVHPDYQGKGE
jgi:hypothetical protein